MTSPNWSRKSIWRARQSRQGGRGVIPTVGRLFCIASLPPLTGYRPWAIRLMRFLGRSSRLAHLNLGVTNVGISMWVRRWIQMPKWRCPVPFDLSQGAPPGLQLLLWVGSLTYLLPNLLENLLVQVTKAYSVCPSSKLTEIQQPVGQWDLENNRAPNLGVSWIAF